MGVAALPSTPRSGNPERPFGRRILPLGFPSGISNRGSGDNNSKSILILLLCSPLAQLRVIQPSVEQTIIPTLIPVRLAQSCYKKRTPTKSRDPV